VAASVFWEPNCDPGRFEMMLKLQDNSLLPVEKTPSLTHELFISKLYPITLMARTLSSYQQWVTCM
jgi:hypothetical protein